MKAWVLFVAWLVWAAAAAEPSAADLYKVGKEAFEAGRLDAALGAFEGAYARSKKPELLLNMAQCQRALGRRHEAIALFENFLAQAPTHALASATRKTLEELRASAPKPVELAPVESAPPPALAAVATPVVEAAPARTGLWVGLGVGAGVVAATAVVLGILLAKPAAPQVAGTVTLPAP